VMMRHCLTFQAFPILPCPCQEPAVYGLKEAVYQVGRKSQEKRFRKGSEKRFIVHHRHVLLTFPRI
jgi:hypothetical protein